MSNYQIKDNHILAEYDSNGNSVTQDDLNNKFKKDIEDLKANGGGGGGLSPADRETLNKVPVLESQLDDKAHQVDFKIANEKGNKYIDKSRIRPCVTFISDDLTKFDLSITAPIYKEKGVKGVMCGITKFLLEDDPNKYYLGLNDIRRLRDEFGIEIQSHTHTHPRLAELTNEADIEYEFAMSKKTLLEKGFNADSLIYPYGIVDERCFRIARKYFRSAIDIKGNYNTIPLTQYRLKRYDFDNSTLAQCKAQVDNAKTYNGWTIFMFHSAWFVDGQGQDNGKAQQLRDLIEYCKSSGVDIVGVTEGLDIFGNSVDVGNYQEDGSRNPLNDYFVVGADGELYSPLYQRKTIHKPRNFLCDTTNWSNLLDNATYICNVKETAFAELPSCWIGLAIFEKNSIRELPMGVTKSGKLTVYNLQTGETYHKYYNPNNNTLDAKFKQVDGLNGLKIVSKDFIPTDQLGYYCSVNATTFEVKEIKHFNNAIFNKTIITNKSGLTKEQFNDGVANREMVHLKAYKTNEWVNYPELVSLATFKVEYSYDYIKEMDSVLIGRNKVLPDGLVVDGVCEVNGKVKVVFRNLSSTTMPANGTYLQINIIKTH